LRQKGCAAGWVAAGAWDRGIEGGCADAWVLRDQALIRAYLSNGLRMHLAEREALRVKENAVKEFSERLRALGVEERVIREAAEM